MRAAAISAVNRATRERVLRGPTLRTLVKLATRAADAGELGRALRQRFARSERGRHRHRDDEFDCRIDELERRPLGGTP